MTTWILVSDASRSKLFSAAKREDNWSLIKEFEHPEGRETSSQIRPSSPPGRRQKSDAQGAHRSSMEPHTWPKEAEAERFAKHLTSYLDHAAEKGELDVLVLVAPPHFLGMLHGALAAQTQKHLQTTVDKDLVMFDAAEIRERLLDIAFPPQSMPHMP